jgi:hypothetical protein
MRGVSKYGLSVAIVVTLTLAFNATGVAQEAGKAREEAARQAAAEAVKKKAEAAAAAAAKAADDVKKAVEDASKKVEAPKKEDAPKKDEAKKAAKDDDPFGETPAAPPKATAEKAATAKSETTIRKKSADKKPETKPDDKSKDKEPDDDAEPVKPRKVLDPDMIKLFLADGTVIAGKLTLKAIEIDTEFGRLSVPVVRVRAFRPGLESFPEVSKKIASQVESLGSNDFKVREEAQKELLAMGLPIRAELRQHTGDSNSERVRRIRDILSKLDELAEESDDPTAGEQAWLRGDAIETDEFKVVGKIVPQSFTMESKYGTLAVKLGDIRNAKRDTIEEAVEIRRVFSVEGQYIAQVQFKDSKIRVQRGDRVNISADGRITMSPWGTNATTGPDGATNYGQANVGGQNFPGGTLVGKIGNSGKVIKVGSRANFVADATGTLQFGVVVHSSYARRGYSFPGQYDLKIRVDRDPNK